MLAGGAGQDFQQLGMTDQLLEAADAQAGHDLAGFLGDEAEVVHHLVCCPPEVIEPQHVVLSSDAGGAVIEVADAQVFAAQRYHRRRAKAKAFRAEHGRLDHIEAGFQATIGL